LCFRWFTRIRKVMKNRRIGVWLIGAKGSISATVMVGAMALRRGLAAPTGMITVTAPFDDLRLVDTGSLHFGGCDVRQGTVVEAAHRLANETGAVRWKLIEAVEEDLAGIEPDIEQGTVLNCGTAIEDLACGGGCETSLRDEVSRLRECLARFKSRKALDELIVVNLASTEPSFHLDPCHEDPAAFEECLDRNISGALRASTLYAYAAVREGCPYINFTPSAGALIPAIISLAEKEGVPVMGNDGKTGETLVKSALAPMFLCRNLEVLSWEGFNLLGNMDGCVLDHPENKQSKIRTKDQVLSRILGYAPHSRVHIHYVPSLDDQKTAWDFIHFKGFLDARMSLQFVWQGYDSLLAAPLVLDLVRLAELAARRGEKGLMPHLASYFKDPLGVSEYRLTEQYRMLMDYAMEVRKSLGANADT